MKQEQMPIDEAVSKIKAVLTTNEMVIAHRVGVDETAENAQVRVFVRARNWIDSPTDIVRAMRKIRGLVPRPYSVKFDIRTII